MRESGVDHHGDPTATFYLAPACWSRDNQPSWLSNVRFLRGTHRYPQLESLLEVSPKLRKFLVSWQNFWKHALIRKHIIPVGSLSVRDFADNLSEFMENFAGGGRRRLECCEKCTHGYSLLWQIELAGTKFAKTGRKTYFLNWFLDPQAGRGKCHDFSKIQRVGLFWAGPYYRPFDPMFCQTLMFSGLWFYFSETFKLSDLQTWPWMLLWSKQPRRALDLLWRSPPSLRSFWASLPSDSSMTSSLSSSGTRGHSQA